MKDSAVQEGSGIGRHFSPKYLEENLEIKKSWLYGHVHAGTLPFDYVKVGHYLRFPEQSVREYLDRMTREAVAQ